MSLVFNTIFMILKVKNLCGSMQRLAAAYGKPHTYGSPKWPVVACGSCRCLATSLYTEPTNQSSVTWDV